MFSYISYVIYIWKHKSLREISRPAREIYKYIEEKSLYNYFAARWTQARLVDDDGDWNDLNGLDGGSVLETTTTTTTMMTLH